MRGFQKQAEEEDPTKVAARDIKRAGGLKLASAVLLPGERNLQLHGLSIDVVERDIAPDPLTGKRRHDINIIVRVLPGFEWPEKQVKIALAQTFSSPEDIELLIQHQKDIRRQIGVALDDFDNLFIGVKWPRSKNYSADAIKTHFVGKLARLY